jgi:hypothetical protein
MALCHDAFGDVEGAHVRRQRTRFSITAKLHAAFSARSRAGIGAATL